MNEVAETPDARRRAVIAVEAGDFHAFRAAAEALVSGTEGVRPYSVIRRLIAGDAAGRLGLKRIKVALLSSFSIEFIHDALIGCAALDGLEVEVFQAGFGQFRQEILDGGSGLYRFAPDVTIVAVEGRQWLGDAGDLFSESAAAEQAVAKAIAEVRSLIESYRSRSDALLLIHNIDAPPASHAGILDGKSGSGRAELAHQFNVELWRLCRGMEGTYVVDYAGLVAEYGRERWIDERMAHYAKAPLAASAIPRLARYYLRYCRAKAGRSRKCIVLDLDNTLWGGVVGEDGLNGIQLGPDYPGSAFRDFQRVLKSLRSRGVMLAIASKNNETDAGEVFLKHPHAVLKLEDFVATEINWTVKSESIRRIAASLDIGLDHVVFVDDNPAERAEVRRTLPTVTVIELPSAPERYCDALLSAGFFDVLALSEEDRNRTELYRQRAKAQELVTAASSIDDYYRSLQMRMTVAPVDSTSLARAAQLTQKTNQFNATTVRYTEPEMATLAKDEAWFVRSIRLSDQFGDNGIVGLLMAQVTGRELVVDTFLLSCRVIGRTVETGMLSVLVEEARRRGVVVVRGRINWTAKNAPVRDLYARHGFELVGGSLEGDSEWKFDLDSGRGVECPEWLHLDFAT